MDMGVVSTKLSEKKTTNTPHPGCEIPRGKWVGLVVEIILECTIPNSYTGIREYFISHSNKDSYINQP